MENEFVQIKDFTYKNIENIKYELQQSNLTSDDIYTLLSVYTFVLREYNLFYLVTNITDFYYKTNNLNKLVN